MNDLRSITASLLMLFILGTCDGLAQVSKVPNLPNYDYVPYHFGFSLAMNQMFFTVKPIPNMQNTWFKGQSVPDIAGVDSARVYSLESRETFGFTIGIISNLRLGEYFDLRFVPDLAFGERELIYRMEYDDRFTPGFSPVKMEQPKKVYSTFVEFPLHIKYKALRLQNNRAYILAGVKYTIDLASEAKKNQDELDNKHVKIKKHDYLAELGVGFDFYTVYFKFGVELKMSYSFNDILVREDNIYTDTIDKLYSKLFQVSFTFE